MWIFSVSGSDDSRFFILKILLQGFIDEDFLMEHPDLDKEKDLNLQAVDNAKEKESNVLLLHIWSFRLFYI